MGRIETTDETSNWLLSERSIIGRSHACTVRLRDACVSAEHALLRWNSRAWELQDLGSRNGTFVAGRCIAVGERVTLAPGELLGFGRPDGFRFVEAAPPVPFAIPVAGGAPIEASGGLLVLPDALSPELTIYRGRENGWVVEQDGQLSAVSDGAPVQTRAGAWRLCLPESLPATEEALDSQPTIDTIALRFRVSSDEETVELLALHGRTVIDLKVRTHHYPLLLLARARLSDADKPIERQGWLQQSELCRQLRSEPDRLYIDIFRMRRQLADSGIADAGKVIERRPGTGLIRIGVSRLDVGPLY
jgi:hypothetical protein